MEDLVSHSASNELAQKVGQIRDVDRKILARLEERDESCVCFGFGFWLFGFLCNGGKRGESTLVDLFASHKGVQGLRQQN